MPMTRDEKIEQLENRGDLDPNCLTCINHFYPFYKNKWDEVTNNTTPFAPSHRASKYCKSGGHAHCSCDTCF